MQLDLTPEQARIRDAARKLPAVDGASSASATAEFGARLAGLGLHGVQAGVEHGGAGLDALSLALAIEEISAVSPTFGEMVWATNALFVEALRLFGTPTQQAEMLAPVVAGRAIGCFALDEGPHGERGATVAELRDDGSFVLSGTKRYVVLGRVANHAVVIAKTRGGSSAFLVSAETGCSRQPEGPRASAKLVFDELVVPPEALLGAEGAGDMVVAATVNASRLAIGAHAVGLARGALELAAAHVRERKANTPVAELQSATFALADMATSIDAARLLVHAAATSDMDPGACAMAKLFASEVATRVTLRALELFGLDAAKADELDRYHRAARRTVIEGSGGERLRAEIAALEVRELREDR